jgi:hypothetical protein
LRPVVTLVVPENFHADINQTRGIPAGLKSVLLTNELRHQRRWLLI